MPTTRVAAILEDRDSPVSAARLGCILDFFGIPWHCFQDVRDLARSRTEGSLYGIDHSVLAPLPLLGELVRLNGASTEKQSLFLYVTEDAVACSKALHSVPGRITGEFREIRGAHVRAVVSTQFPHITGPMHGLEVMAEVHSDERSFATDDATSISTIIDSKPGSLFFNLPNNPDTFVSCSSRIPNLAETIKGGWFDVRTHFLSAVPLLLYLKWAFRDVCWQTYEAGACLILDDPLLRTKYGFCDFQQLDDEMEKHGFTTNIAFIPWNIRRTSRAMASLIKKSRGRLSVSVHGCDHTAREFGTSDISTLNAKISSAKSRMERHQERTGISHDVLMVFPQGVFSRESLTALQQNQFVAAVNTEALPFEECGEVLTIGDAWSVALLKYGSFPLFTRRYPNHRIENFAFDFLLGKPCLIVEHHEFFKGQARDAVQFADALNSMNADLQWRSLGEVIKRCYQWRRGPDSVVQIRMFANELLITNSNREDLCYQIQKRDKGSVGIKEIKANGEPIAWQTDGYEIVFNCKVPSGGELFIQIRYTPPEKHTEVKYALGSFLKVAARRYLSEFRDNVLSRNDRLMRVARRVRAIGGQA